MYKKLQPEETIPGRTINIHTHTYSLLYIPSILKLVNMEVRFGISHKNTKHTDTAQYKNITWVLSQNCYETDC